MQEYFMIISSEEHKKGRSQIIVNVLRAMNRFLFLECLLNPAEIANVIINDSLVFCDFLIGHNHFYH